MQAGVVEFFSFLVIIILAFIGIGYFVVLPFYALKFLTKKWRKRNKSILIATYTMLLIASSIIVFCLPSYLMRTYYWDILPFYKLASYYAAFLIFLFLPLIYIGIASLIYFLRFHGHVVTIESCNQPSGYKMEEKEHE